MCCFGYFLEADFPLLKQYVPKIIQPLNYQGVNKQWSVTAVTLMKTINVIFFEFARKSEVALSICLEHWRHDATVSIELWMMSDS